MLYSPWDQREELPMKRDFFVDPEVLFVRFENSPSFSEKDIITFSQTLSCDEMNYNIDNLPTELIQQTDN